MNPEAPDLKTWPQFKTWTADRLRGTNWAAAGISAALQGGVLAMLIMMGMSSMTEQKRDKPLVTVLATAERSATPPPPAPPQPKPEDKPVIQPRADVVAPPVKMALSDSPPVAAAPQRAPDPPAPQPAAPSTPSAAPAAPAGTGPIKANLASNLLSSPAPVFPNSSRRKHESGVVTVRVVVGEDGRVDEISVQRSSGFPELDQAVLTAVRKWRWSPRMDGGRPVRVTGLIPINMVLRES